MVELKLIHVSERVPVGYNEVMSFLHWPSDDMILMPEWWSIWISESFLELARVNTIALYLDYFTVSLHSTNVRHLPFVWAVHGGKM